MKHQIVYLDQKTVDELKGGDMKLAVEDIEEVLSLYDKGEVIAPHKTAMGFGKTVEDENIYGRINGMPGYVKGRFNMAGIKWIGSNPKNVEKGFPRASALTILNDPDSKLPLAVMDGTTISATRTGAVGGVAVKYLSKANSKVVALIGAGVQNRTQLAATLIARPNIEQVYVNDLYYDRSVVFAADMSKELGVNVEAAHSAEEICRKADIIITATVSSEPIVQADWVKPGTLMINVGGNEYTDEAVLMADKTVVDTWENVKARNASTIAIMANKGTFMDAQIYAELGAIVNGKKPGRENDEELIYFDSVGMGIEDIAIASRVYRKALAENKGIWLPYWE